MKKPMLDVRWLANVERSQLDRVLLEYELISRSFVPWLLHVMANAKDEAVRQLVMPNLLEENGEFGKNNSHHALYLKMLDSLGLKYGTFRHANFTIDAEEAFRTIFRGEDTYRSLCVLGPAIEAISSDFLGPMYDRVKQYYGDAPRHMIYFPLHLCEMEDEHAKCIEQALSILEAKNPRLAKNRSKFVKEGIKIFQEFWNNMRIEVKG
ncbi:MAG: iron-containing redox enzyme family protein [Acidobacteria bacterium]|nr:iron-containing redox enzyme family protein [Acidobacteriota bacterium]